MTPKTRILAHGLLLLVGLALMIAGIVSETHGATAIGLIVAGVNAQQFLSRRKGDASHPRN